jgi:hypothetical protein
VDLVARRVEHDAQRRQRTRPGILGEPRRLRVDRERPGPRELAAARPEDEAGAGRHGPDMHAQPAPAQHAREDRRIGAGERALGSAQLARQHNVTRLQLWSETAADTRDQRRAGLGVEGQRRRRPRPPRTHADPLDPAPRRAAAHRPRLGAHRREHEQFGFGGPAVGLHPAHDAHRASAMIGKIRR